MPQCVDIFHTLMDQFKVDIVAIVSDAPWEDAEFEVQGLEMGCWTQWISAYMTKAQYGSQILDVTETITQA